MARLGELLVAAGTLTSDQIEQGLRAQVMWGGRIGTNLVELGYVDLDKLATALGKQHRLPAALGKHFEKGDPEVQRMLPTELAEKYSCIPLLRVGPGRTQIIIASIAPLGRKALAIVAEAMGVEPKAFVQSIAGELRIRYHLERAFKIPRSTRFLRARGKTIPPFPVFEIDPLAFEDSAVDVPIEAPAHDPSEAPASGTRPSEPAKLRSAALTDIPIVIAPIETRPAEPITIPPQDVHADDDADGDFSDIHAELEARLANKALANKRQTTIPPPIFDPDIDAIFDGAAIPERIEEDDSSGRERRRYVRTIDADSWREVADAPRQSDLASDSEHSLGRIPIKRMQLAAAQETPANTLTLGEATRAIRRSTDRDRVAELVCETLFRFMMSCDSALLFVIRGETAISWKGFSRAGATVPEIAVPLGQPGLIPRVIERGSTLRLHSSDLGPIDQLVLVSLGHQTGDLVVVPISISNQVMCVIAMATQADQATTTAESIAAAAGAAFARLMRNASR